MGMVSLGWFRSLLFCVIWICFVFIKVVINMVKVENIIFVLIFCSVVIFWGWFENCFVKGMKNLLYMGRINMILKSLKIVREVEGNKNLVVMWWFMVVLIFIVKVFICERVVYISKVLV